MAVQFTTSYLEDALAVLRQYKSMVERSISQIDDAALTRYRREHVGFVFQFYNLIPSLTARENVALVTEISRDPMPPDEALEIVGLSERMDHFPSQLSGGEQQRVAIARAIAKRPSVLLCDDDARAAARNHGERTLQSSAQQRRAGFQRAVLLRHRYACAVDRQCAQPRARTSCEDDRPRLAVIRAPAGARALLGQMALVDAREIPGDVHVLHCDSPSIDGGVIVPAHADETLTRA